MSHVSSCDTSIIGQILVYHMAYDHKVATWHMAMGFAMWHMAITFSMWHMVITFAMWPTTCIYLPTYFPTIYIPTYRLNKSTYLPM